jgi:hypothetical protein
MFHGQLSGFAQTDDIGYVFGAGPAASLLVAAYEERFEFGAFADVQGADAFGGVNLVSGTW